MSYHPQQTATPSPNAKADQIVYRVFNKLVLVVADARAPAGSNTSQPSSNNLGPFGGRENVTGGAIEPLREDAAPGLSTRESKPPRSDKWFNLETPDTGLYKATLEAYRSISVSYALHAIPSLHISVLLSIPPLNSSSGIVLVHQSPASSDIGETQTRVTPPPRYILLETHTLSLLPSSSLSFSSSSASSSVELSTVYKQCISLFRSLYTMLRVLPAWKLHRKLKRRSSCNALPLGGSGLSIEVQVGVGRPVVVDDDSVAGFDAPHSQSPESLGTESISFPAIQTPLGHFAFRTMYRLHSNYSLESLESLLSTHFMTPALNHPAIPLPPTKAKVDDAPVQFTPTITSAYQRQRKESLGSGSAASATNARAAPLPSLGNTSNVSLSSRPFPSRPAPSTDIGIGVSPLTSAPIRTALPHSPTASSPPSVPHSPNKPATLHLHSSNSSISSSPRPRRISTLNPAASSDQYLGGAGVSNASPRLVFGGYGRDGGDLPFAVGLSGRTSGSMDRTRKESLLGGSNTADRAQSSSSSTSTHFGARRPSVTSIHPFKSGTVASSPSSHSLSVRLNSPLSQNLPAQTSPGGFLSPYGDNIKKFPSIGGGPPETHVASSGLTPVSVAGGPQRYLSSFSHRHMTGGPSIGNAGPAIADIDRGLGMGVGVPGSLGKHGSGLGEIGSLIGDSPLKRRTASETCLTIPPEDDELSNFVKAIDSRAPLRGGLDFDATLPPMAEESRRSSHSNPPSPMLRHRNLGGTSGTQRGASIVTSRADVDEALRRMTESFQVGVGSLEGGMRARRRRTESASATFGGSGASGSERETRSSRHPGVSALVSALEEDSASSASGSIGVAVLRGSQGGRRPSNLSSSSLFTPGHTGRQSYESDQQIVGRMELGNEGHFQTNLQYHGETSHLEGSARPFARPPSGSRRY